MVRHGLAHLQTFRTRKYSRHSRGSVQDLRRDPVNEMHSQGVRNALLPSVVRGASTIYATDCNYKEQKRRETIDNRLY